MLKTNHTLLDLNLRYNKIGRDAASYICIALKTNTTLVNLNLAYNMIGIENATIITTALTANSALEELDLTCNDLGAEGARYIGTALKTNTRVTVLNLGQNNIGDEGAKHIAAALAINRHITELNLHYNEINDEGAICIADALADNTSVTHLGLYDNNVSDEGGNALATLLQSNQTIISLRLDLKWIKNNIFIQITRALDANRYRLFVLTKNLFSTVRLPGRPIELTNQALASIRRIELMLKKSYPEVNQNDQHMAAIAISIEILKLNAAMANQQQLIDFRMLAAVRSGTYSNQAQEALVSLASYQLATLYKANETNDDKLKRYDTVEKTLASVSNRNAAKDGLLNIINHSRSLYFSYPSITNSNNDAPSDISGTKRSLGN